MIYAKGGQAGRAAVCRTRGYLYLYLYPTSAAPALRASYCTHGGRGSGRVQLELQERVEMRSLGYCTVML
jgi:hypothetical protein